MKKIIIGTLFLLFGFVFSVQAISPANLAYYPIPFAPATSFTNIIAINTQITTTAGSLKTLYDTVEETAKSGLAQALSTLYQFDKPTEKVDGAPGQGKYTFCGKAISKVDVKDISEKYKYFFTTVRNKQAKNVNAKIAARKKFIKENLVAMKVAINTIERKILNFDTEIEKVRQCSGEGSGADCKHPSLDGGLNEILYAYGDALKTLDDIVRLWENVVALKARLVALQTLNDIQFQEATEVDNKKHKSSKSAMLLNDSSLIGKGGYREVIVNGFALFDFENKLSEKATSVASSASSLKNKLSEKADSVKSSIVGAPLNFNLADDTSEVHPIAEKKDKLLAVNAINDVTPYVDKAMNVHNLQNSLPEYRSKALEAEKEEERYKKILQALIEADKCGIRYMSRFFTNPEVAWSGGDMKENAHMHDIRKGISGWAYNIYTVGKSAKTSIVDNEEIGTISYSDEEKSELSDDPDASKASKFVENEDVGVAASKEEEVAQDSRQTTLMAWDIGAQAAHMIVNNPEQWGMHNGKRYVWTDSKRLYENYLEQKYDNIKFYLKRYTNLDTMRLVYAVVTGGSYSLYEAANQVEIMKKLSDLGETLLGGLNAHTQAKENARLARINQINSLKAQNSSVIAEIDAVEKEIKENKQKIEDIRSSGENKGLAFLKKIMTGPVKFPEPGEIFEDIKVTFMSPEETSAEADSQNKENVDEVKVKDLKAKNKELKDKRKGLEKDLATIKDNIAKIIDGSHTQQAGYTPDLQAGLESVVTLINTLTTNSIAGAENNIQSFIANKKEKEDINVLGCKSAATNAIDALNNKIDSLVDDTLEDILALGDELYTPSGYKKAVEIHNSMLSNLKSLRILVSTRYEEKEKQEESVNENGETATTTVIEKNLLVSSKLSNSSGALVFGDLKNVNDQAETEGLFVGAAPKKRDFKAPFASYVFYSPDVREIFHFDADDFVVAKPQVEGKIKNKNISAIDFLSYGGNIPTVWKHMLKDNTFIERKYDLSKALSIGCENETFARGGVFPCIVDGTNYLLDRVHTEEKYLLSDGTGKNLPKCTKLLLKDKKITSTLFNSKIKTSEGTVETKVGCKHSELGMLLDSDADNNLFFKDYAFKMYKTLAEDDDNKDFKDKEKNEYAIASYPMFNKNIISSFLEFSEYEANMKKQFETVKNEYEELKKQLYEQLGEYGFSPSESLDLAKEEDYNLVVEKLKEIKKDMMKQAEEKIADVDKKENEVVKEASEKLERLLDYLDADSDAVMKISMADAENKSFKSELRKKKTDKAVIREYKKSLKEKEAEQNEDLIPYCANF